MWEQAEKGESLKSPVDVLSFENAFVLMKTLSPKRLSLLQALHQIGVILETDGKYSVPWETIVTEISLSTPSVLKRQPRKRDNSAAA